MQFEQLENVCDMRVIELLTEDLKILIVMEVTSS
jgi:hypothetical protein